MSKEACPECGKEFEFESEMKTHRAVLSHMLVHKKDMPKNDQNDAATAEATTEAVGDVTAARQRSEAATETLAEKVARLRKERKPIGIPERQWSCPENDGYQYRVFNDNWMARPGNIQRAQAAGYEFVRSDDEKEMPKIVGTNENGTAIKGYLMRIPKEIYDEDQTAKQREIDKVDQQIRTGRFQQGANDSRYVPAGGIKITSDNRAPES